MHSNRIKWIDIAKSIALILVVLGHVLRFGDVHNIVYSFHVPLFFFLSGTTAKEELSMRRISSDAKRLLLPYFLWGAISIVVYAFMWKFASPSLTDGESFSARENVAKLIYCSSILPFNAPLYFLPCLFITKLWHSLICHIQRNRVVQICFSILGAAIGFVFSETAQFSLPVSFELMLKMYPFFLLGRIISRFLTEMGEKTELRCRFLLFSVIFFSFTAVLGLCAPPVNYTNNNIPAPILFYFIAMIGIGGTYCLSVFLSNVRWLLYLGRKTIAVLVMHKFPIVFFQVVGPFAEILSNPNSLQSLILGGIPVTVISIVLSLAVGYVLETHFPIFLGKSKAQ